MRAELEQLNSRLDAMSREDLILSIKRLIEECAEKDAMLEIDSAASTEMSIQFQQIKEENTCLKKVNKELLLQNRNLSEQLQMRNRDLFGRKSEQASGLVDALLDDEPEDPISESGSDPEDGTSGDPGSNDPGSGTPASAADLKDLLFPRRSHKRGGKKSPGKRKADLDSLPTRTVYDLNVDELDRMYGPGNWRIAFWRQEDTIESVHTVQYHKRTFRPIVSVGLEHTLEAPYPCGKLLPGSLASSSLIAEVMYQKVMQCVPSYRMEADFIRSGVPLSRQTITNWINRFSLDLFITVAEHMKVLLLQRAYNQCDETTYEVIRDGRKAGAKSFMWVHTTSELDPDRPIIVFCFELTRGTDHLRHFYGDAGYVGNITSDAYCSYDTLEKEYADIGSSGCLMHARRKFHDAAMLINVKGVSMETLRDLPEFKALALLDEINDAEQPLKKLTPEERLRIRQETVKEKVDAFFEYISTLDADDPSYSETLSKAIHYSTNQEKKLRRFLEDAMIPCDNGFCERAIKPLATSRRNWLFSYSIDGAEAAAILFTLIETAKANQAHPYYYLKYLLETLPGQIISTQNAFLDDCMPWSEAYKAYEEREKQAAMRFFADQSPVEKPRTPRKKDKSA